MKLAPWAAYARARSGLNGVDAGRLARRPGCREALLDGCHGARVFLLAEQPHRGGQAGGAAEGAVDAVDGQDSLTLPTASADPIWTIREIVSLAVPRADLRHRGAARADPHSEQRAVLGEDDRPERRVKGQANRHATTRSDP